MHVRDDFQHMYECTDSRHPILSKAGSAVLYPETGSRVMPAYRYGGKADGQSITCLGSHHDLELLQSMRALAILYPLQVPGKPLNDALHVQLPVSSCSTRRQQHN